MFLGKTQNSHFYSLYHEEKLIYRFKTKLKLVDFRHKKEPFTPF